MMRGQGADRGELRDTFVSAVNTALVVGTAVSVLVAGVAAYVLAQRLLRPVEDVGVAAGIVVTEWLGTGPRCSSATRAGVGLAA